MPCVKGKPKPYNWDQKLKSAIRKIWRNSPTRRAALAAAKHPDQPAHVICKHCLAIVHQKLCIVEHIIPVVPVTGFDSWDAYIARMQSTDLAVYCEACAKTKTALERQQRNTNKKRARK